MKLVGKEVQNVQKCVDDFLNVYIQSLFKLNPIRLKNFPTAVALFIETVW